jgi:hypothetical protein
MNDSLKIDQYISALPKWQQEICTKARRLIHQADESITETIKFTNRPYFIHKGNVCALLATKDHINIFIYDPTAPDPKGIINQGHDNKTARSIQVYTDTFPDENAFVDLIAAVVRNNEKGGWRALNDSTIDILTS